MRGLNLRVGSVHLVHSNWMEGTEGDPVMVVLRHRRSGWDLVAVSPSWVGSRRIGMEGARYMRRSQDGHRMLAVLLVSSKLRGATRSHGGP